MRSVVSVILATALTLIPSGRDASARVGVDMHVTSRQGVDVKVGQLRRVDVDVHTHVVVGSFVDASSAVAYARSAKVSSFYPLIASSRWPSRRWLVVVKITDVSADRGAALKVLNSAGMRKLWTMRWTARTAMLPGAERPPGTLFVPAAAAPNSVAATARLPIPPKATVVRPRVSSGDRVVAFPAVSRSPKIRLIRGRVIRTSGNQPKYNFPSDMKISRSEGKIERFRPVRWRSGRSGTVAYTAGKNPSYFYIMADDTSLSAPCVIIAKRDDESEVPMEKNRYLIQMPTGRTCEVMYTIENREYEGVQ